jgi:type-F conjugative transfer system secretin TraK
MFPVFGSLLELLRFSSLEALQTYPLKSQGHLTVTVSKDQQNRIAVKNDRISQIFCSDGQLEIKTDEVHGQIFVRFLEKEAQPLSLTLITEKGVTQDLTLRPSKRVSESIVLTDPTPQKKVVQESPLKLLQDMRSRKILMLKTAKADRSLKSETLTLTLLGSVTSGEFEGRLFELENTSPKTVYLHEKHFALPKDRVLVLEDLRLTPKQKTELWVVSSRGGKTHEAHP